MHKGATFVYPQAQSILASMQARWCLINSHARHELTLDLRIYQHSCRDDSASLTWYFIMTGVRTAASRTQVLILSALQWCMAHSRARTLCDGCVPQAYINKIASYKT